MHRVIASTLMFDLMEAYGAEWARIAVLDTRTGGCMIRDGALLFDFLPVHGSKPIEQPLLQVGTCQASCRVSASELYRCTWFGD